MSDIEVRNLAQPEFSMFERNIAILAAGQKEVLFNLSDGRSIKGFIVGLDEGYCQVRDSSKGDKVHYVLIHRSHVISLEESGRTLERVEKSSSVGIDDVEHFVRVSKAFLRKSGRNREEHSE